MNAVEQEPKRPLDSEKQKNSSRKIGERNRKKPNIDNSNP